MLKALKTICNKTKDVVMTIGSKVVQKIKRECHTFTLKFRKLSNACKQVSQKAIEGEYLGKGGLIVAGSASLTFAGNALAAVPEGVTTAITSAATDVATVGAAVILVHIGIKVWRWIRSAF